MKINAQFLSGRFTENYQKWIPHIWHHNYSETNQRHLMITFAGYRLHIWVTGDR